MRAALLAVVLAALPACSLIDAASEGGVDCVDEGCFAVLEVDPELVAPTVVAVGQVVGDSLPDVVVGDRENGEVVVMENGGGGGLFHLGSFEVEAPLWMAIADFHGEEGLEVLCLSGAAELVLLGVDEEGLHELSRGPVDQLPAYIANGDFDDDGAEDFGILYPAKDQDGLQVFRGNGDGSFDGPFPTFAPGVGSGPLVAGDFDNDNNIDLLTGHDGMIKVYVGKGNVDFDDYEIVGVVPEAILAGAAVDISDDGLEDLILATGGGTGRVQFLLNEGEDGLADGSLDTVVEDFEIISDVVAGGDLDGDGHLDVIAFNADRQGDLPDAVTFRSLGSDQGFDDSIWLFMDDPLGGAAAGDMDGDSDTDIAVTVPSQGIVRTYLSELH